MLTPIPASSASPSLLNDIIASVKCIVSQCHSAGDHTIFVGLVEAAEIAEGKPLVYFRGDYAALISRSQP